WTQNAKHAVCFFIWLMITEFPPLANGMMQACFQPKRILYCGGRKGSIPNLDAGAKSNLLYHYFHLSMVINVAYFFRLAGLGVRDDDLAVRRNSNPILGPSTNSLFDAFNCLMVKTFLVDWLCTPWRIGRPALTSLLVRV